jgi:hypothetical protein
MTMIGCLSMITARMSIKSFHNNDMMNNLYKIKKRLTHGAWRMINMSKMDKPNSNNNNNKLGGRGITEFRDSLGKSLNRNDAHSLLQQIQTQNKDKDKK